MDTQTVTQWMTSISAKRQTLVKLLDEPNLGTLRIDVNQAIEEIDDLIDEFQRTFPTIS
jgi:hypothetical protein